MNLVSCCESSINILFSRIISKWAKKFRKHNISLNKSLTLNQIDFLYPKMSNISLLNILVGISNQRMWAITEANKVAKWHKASVASQNDYLPSKIKRNWVVLCQNKVKSLNQYKTNVLWQSQHWEKESNVPEIAKPATSGNLITSLPVFIKKKKRKTVVFNRRSAFTWASQS